jgi:hypothetical protein
MSDPGSPEPARARQVIPVTLAHLVLDLLPTLQDLRGVQELPTTAVDDPGCWHAPLDPPNDSAIQRPGLSSRIAHQVSIRSGQRGTVGT